ncbi:Fe(3+) ABC transporter substrate-binding protein [Afifella sp. IM 167]|uniref:Fe(3+) ABC transporter substrate-binding protein n=1 Tax=Afifella sp. IM 167 TaxID=2033586 RepID=UPI001CCC1B9D|nr:Fe(3+) ABC transporter substrate-binding protein [Afifella sp. IM 167]MBZ8135073.1 iron ABC transporter substrate-binding protein [Afifella sp. IM 167]
MFDFSRRPGTLTALLIGGAVALLGPGSASAEEKGEVNIYSYRQPYLIAPITEAFEKETGIRVNTVFLAQGLEERIQAEGANSPADVIMTVDIGRLENAKQMGITQPVTDEVIERDIPAQYRDPEGHWFGLTTRSRVVYASKERVEQDTITYEELSDPKWKGRICIRSGQHVYNIGLIASMIAHHGEEATEEWLRGLKNNLARRPEGNDRNQAKGIFSGECDIAVGNTYYVGVMATNEEEPEQKEWANALKILFPNNDARGAHVNISGMAMAKNAPHPENALKFMEFATRDEAQHIYAEKNFEYPVKAGVPASDIVASWGEIHPDELPLAEIARYRKKASELVDKVGFDEGPSS